MTVHEFGQDKEKHLLFFPGSCEPRQEFAYAAKELAARYHVLLVTPDGHDPEEGTDFISVEKTVDDTADWLREHGIDQLDALYGLSFGGGMAVRFLTTQNIHAERVIIDAGTAPYRYPKWICRLICVKDYLVFKLGRASLAAMEAAFPSERFARDKANAKCEYREMQKYLKTFSDRTIWNIFWSANNYSVPKTAPEIRSKIQFWVGDEEWKGRYRDLKWTKEYLPQIETVTIPHMMHGELVMMHPKEFAARALAFFDEDQKR
ncbi:MAG: alpha/beta hydrolase [Clostridia bacterium]|nr:alpha/beta hydrolase [Clostridia bacterium]